MPKSPREPRHPSTPSWPSAPYAPRGGSARLPPIRNMDKLEGNTHSGDGEDASHYQHSVRGTHRPINPALNSLKPADRTKKGCITCRIRGKKCSDPIEDGRVPAGPCSNCDNARHRVQCLGYGAVEPGSDGFKTPAWLSALEAELKAQIRAFNSKKLHSADDFLEFDLHDAPPNWTPYFGQAHPSNSSGTSSDPPSLSLQTPTSSSLTDAGHSASSDTPQHSFSTSLPIQAWTNGPYPSMFIDFDLLASTTRHSLDTVDPSLLSTKASSDALLTHYSRFEGPGTGSFAFDAFPVPFGTLQPSDLKAMRSSPANTFLDESFILLIGEGEWPNFS